MPNLKIGCLCVTKGDRAPVFGISFASYVSQHSRQKATMLTVGTKGINWQPYVDVIKRVNYFDGVVGALVDKEVAFLTPKQPDLTVCQCIDLGCAELFVNHKCDLVTFWDDDDWAPSERVKMLSNLHDINGIWTAGYSKGWFCNLRTLRAEHIDCVDWGLWGGSITFNRRTWEDLGGFAHRPLIAYDRSFVTDCLIKSGKVFILKGACPPVAFSHGKNVATWCKGKVEPFEEKLKKWMSAVCFVEVKLGQQFLIDRRIFPAPGVEDEDY